MTLNLLLRMGRVSNLPTVWTNLWAGWILSGAEATLWIPALLLIPVSAMYIGGMILNDVYDVAYDTIERPERPIVAGEISHKHARRWGYGLLLLGILAFALGGASLACPSALRPGILAVLLAALIVIYDRHHKDNVLAPVVMGLCRGVVILLGASWGLSHGDTTVWAVAAMLVAYVWGLTYVASFENRAGVVAWWPALLLYFPGLWVVTHCQGSYLAVALGVGFLLWVARALALARQGRPDRIKAAITSLIAGIALFDAGMMAIRGADVGALGGIAAFLLTLAWQRRVPGT